MGDTSMQRCDGCDCRVSMIEGDADAHDWPCCENFPDNKAPCRYILFALCYSKVDIGSPNCITGTNEWPLFYPATELRKKCYIGCDWVMRPTCAATFGGDDYSAEVQDVVADANQTFPPSSGTGGALAYHEGDYRSGLGGCVAPSTCSGDFDPDCVEELDDRWTLSAAGIDAGDVTLTLTDPTILAWAAGQGKATPVYTNREEWDPFGRYNIMDLTAGRADWPMLPYSLCVGFVDEPGAEENPCETQDDRCFCNDFELGDTVTLLVNVIGCDTISGLQTVGMNRVYSSAGLPCGIAAHFPSPAPCGVFVGTVSTGDGCDEWSGSVYLALWCDSASEMWKIRAWCYSNDSSCYEYAGEGSVDHWDLCWGSVYFEFTLPDLDCCCPDTPIATECCPDDDTPTTLTWDDGTDTGTVTWGGSNWSGTGDICGCTATGVHLQCLDIGGGTYQWDLVIDCLGGGSQPVVTSVTCNPFTVSFSNGAGCDVTLT